MLLSGPGFGARWAAGASPTWRPTSLEVEAEKARREPPMAHPHRYCYFCFPLIRSDSLGPAHWGGGPRPAL